MTNHQLINLPPTQHRPNNNRHLTSQRGTSYSQDLRQLVSTIAMEGVFNPSVREFVVAMQGQGTFPSRQTVARWNALRNRLGHTRACRRTGNRSVPRLQGSPDLILLALFRIAYPKARAAEVNAFLYNANYGNIHFRFYSASQISEAEKFIGLSSKAGSTMAYQAYLPVNVRKRYVYWNYPYPLGVAGVRRASVIDLDECGVYFERGNRRRGKAYVGVRVKQPGPYSRASQKWNLLMAISGEPGMQGQPARRWARTWVDGGTTIHTMYEFLEGVLNDIGHATPQNWMLFTMDNLSAHRNEAIVALIHLYGHGIAYRAPYYAVDGAIEYFFNTLQTMLRSNLHRIQDENALLQVMYQCIQSVDTFENYFIKVGFTIE